MTTALGVWSETHVEVFKSADAVPALKVRMPHMSSVCRRFSADNGVIVQNILELPPLIETMSNPKPSAAGETIARRRAWLFVLALRFRLIPKAAQPVGANVIYPSQSVLPLRTVPVQIAGSAFRQLWRGLQLSVRAEVSSPRAQDVNATYTWTVVSEDSATTDFPPLVLTSGRNPSVLTIPPHTLGYAGSKYVLRVELAGGAQSAASATATGQ